MSTLTIRNPQGETIGEHELADGLLVWDRGDQAVHDAVVAYLANQRAGTASTLGKGEVAGTGQKPWRQKGSGRARAGYRQSPIWRGGSVAFGPKPRSYRKRLTRKTARLAFCRAFSEQVRQGAVSVLDDMRLDAPRTRQVADMLKRLEVTGPALIVVDGVDRNLYLAARNLPRVEVADAQDLHTYQVLRYPRILITQAGLAKLEARLRKRGGDAA
jgi:large subunit ribosomal protein L4